jgi:hypothetical protein
LKVVWLVSALPPALDPAGCWADLKAMGIR